MNKEKGKIFDLKIFSELMHYVKPYKGIYYFVMGAAILLSIFSTLSPYLLKVAVDDYIRPKDYDGMLLIICLMLAALLLEVIFQFLFVYFANGLGQNVIRDLRATLYKKIIGFKMSYFDKSAIGRLVTRAVNDVETIASIFSQGLFMIIADFLKMGLVIVVMLVVNWKLSLIVFLILPLILYATRLFQKSMKIAFEEVRLQVANLNSFVQERISGMQIVQLFHREKIENQNFKSINEKHKKAWLKTVWFNSIFFPVAEIASSLTIGLLVWFGGLNVAAGGAITLGQIFLFIQMSQMLFRPLRHIADKFNTLQMGMVAADRIFKILRTESQIEDLGTLNPDKIDGGISIKNLRFSYITGDEGSILLDKNSIKDFSLNGLRKHIGIVLQDVFLFADTIYNNITLYDTDIDEEDVYYAAKEIGVHDFILSLPGGYQYNVKERGVMLSSGQRQLISFLRVYLSNPSILILDEATSSIDSYAEEMIKSATRKITKGKTSILIAHRLSTIKNTDRIVVMEKGNIVEIGSHKELLANTGGHYSQLHKIQFLASVV